MIRCRWVSQSILQRAAALLILGSDRSQLVCHPLNRRTGATAVTHLPVTTSPIKRSSSTSATRATPWRQTTSSSPVRTASGTAPCRSPVDLHKVCSSQPSASFGVWDTFYDILLSLSTDKEPSSPLGIPALSIVASTASSVALILLLVVLFVLVQPKLKSFHLSR